VKGDDARVSQGGEGRIRRTYELRHRWGPIKGQPDGSFTQFCLDDGCHAQRWVEVRITRVLEVQE
jgi:hypothetical protein